MGTAERERAIVRRSVPIFIVMEKGGETLHPFWQLQVPTVGDRVTVRHREDNATVYEVVRVEWEVTSIRPEPPFLSKVLVHVRKMATPRPPGDAPLEG
jgi:hypothetical protein